LYLPFVYSLCFFLFFIILSFLTLCISFFSFSLVDQMPSSQKEKRKSESIYTPHTPPRTQDNKEKFSNQKADEPEQPSQPDMQGSPDRKGTPGMTGEPEEYTALQLQRMRTKDFLTEKNETNSPKKEEHPSPMRVNSEGPGVHDLNQGSRPLIPESIEYSSPINSFRNRYYSEPPITATEIGVSASKEYGNKADSAGEESSKINQGTDFLKDELKEKNKIEEKEKKEKKTEERNMNKDKNNDNNNYSSNINSNSNNNNNNKNSDGCNNNNGNNNDNGNNNGDNKNSNGNNDNSSNSKSNSNNNIDRDNNRSNSCSPVSLIHYHNNSIGTEKGTVVGTETGTGIGMGYERSVGGGGAVQTPFKSVALLTGEEIEIAEYWVDDEEENEVEERDKNQENDNCCNNYSRKKDYDQEKDEKCENNRYSIDRRLKFTEMENVARQLSSSPKDSEEAPVENVPKERSQKHSQEHSPEHSQEPSKHNSFGSDAGLSVDLYGTYGKELTGYIGYAGSTGNTVTSIPIPPPPLLPPPPILIPSPPTTLPYPSLLPSPLSPPPPPLPLSSHKNGNEVGTKCVTEKIEKNSNKNMNTHVENLTKDGPKPVIDGTRDTDGVNRPAVSASTNSLQRYGTARKIDRIPVAGRGRGVRRTALVPK
jgi:hypothetical protein